MRIFRVVLASALGGKRWRHLRLCVVACAGIVAAAAGAPVAGAGSAPYVATDLGARQHPRTLVTHQPGVTYRFTSLRWTGWGTPRPRARGALAACANMAGCENLGPVTIQLRQLRAGRCGAVRGRYYVRGTIIREARKTPLDLRPSYVC